MNANIGKLAPMPRKALTPQEYRAERDAAAYKTIAERMERILHGGEKNHATAVTDYDIFGHQ